MIMRYMLIALCAVLMLAGCGEKSAPAQGKVSLPEARLITPEEAKAMMDEGGVIVVDVRSGQEYAGGHIEGAISIPLEEIAAKAAELLPDKDAVILVYCRSGMRSHAAAEALADMGYTLVYDFGGIQSWPYDIV
jgi:rhodanese-related sulfurtransferase